MTVHEHLRSIWACQEALDWAAQYNTAREVWDACERLDWLVWWDVRVHGRAGIARLVNLIQEPCCRISPDPRVRAAFLLAADPGSTTDQLCRAAEAAEAAARAARAAGAAAWAAAWAAGAARAARAAWAAAWAAGAARAARAAGAGTVINPDQYRAIAVCPWTEGT